MSSISVETMYRRTLDKVRKSHIGTLTPLTWNRLISDALKEFKKDFWLNYESNRANIDLIFPLKTFLSTYTVEENLAVLPTDWWKPANIRVKVANNNNGTLYPDLETPDLWIPAHELKSGERDSTLRNPFTKSNHKHAYFELRGSSLAFFTSEDNSLLVTDAEIEYYSTPREIWFDSTNMDDNNAYPEDTDGIAAYEDGYGSVNTEMNNDVRTLLIDIASKQYLTEMGVLAPQRQQQQQ